MSNVFELFFKHNTPKNVVISEYVGASEFFLERAQIKFLNAKGKNPGQQLTLKTVILY